MRYRVRFPVQIETVEGHEMPSVKTVSIELDANDVRHVEEVFIHRMQMMFDAFAWRRPGD